MISGYSNQFPIPAYQAPASQSVVAPATQAQAAPTTQVSPETIKVANVLTSIWNGLVSAVKTLFSWLGHLFGGSSSNTTPTASSTSGLDAQQAAIAQQYQLLPTAANVQAFLSEVQGYENDGALGPGSTNTTAVSDLQKALAKLGYNVPVTGQYDSATQQAVTQFKQANGLHQSYQAANGTWAVNEYADQQTLQLIMAKLQQQVASVPVSAPTTSSSPSQPTVNYDAIAKQYGLLDTQANVSAFVSEIQSYQTDGTLGPGSANTTAITDLQKALDKLGYSIPVTGQYDSATSQGVIAFKRANGIHQTYQATDGNWAVNEYAGAQTLNLIMQKLAAAVQPTSNPSSNPAPTQAPGQPQTNYDAIARQYNLLDTEANVNAFIAEIKGYQTAGALGPGSTQTSAIRDLQTALSRLGYSVSVSGQYDAATSQAVMAFKKANGLHQTYQAADGTYAVNEYADPQTLQRIMAKLQQQAASQPASAPSAPYTPASVGQPQPAATGLSAQQAALAQQYHLYPTPANVQAFMAEVGKYVSDGTLGPGSTQTSAIKDLQTVLSRWGYGVSVSGSYDQATANAVVAFKKANGIHQSYRADDGNWAVNEYADRSTLQLIMSKLQAGAKAS